MLNDHLYIIQEWRVAANTAAAVLQLQPEHAIFAGHFPGQPVLPGACMLQMIKELLQTATRRSLTMTHSPVMKFLQPVIPSEHETLVAELSWQEKDGLVHAKATLSKSGAPFFRFTGSFRQ